MDSHLAKIPVAKRRVVNRGAFAAATAVAVAVVTLLVTLGSSGCGNGTPSPTATPSPSPSPVVFISGTTKGSPDAPLTMFMYEDFQCYYCQEFALTTEKELEEAYIETGKVRLIFKHYVIEGEESMQAALASECAAEQNKFWPYYNLLMQTRASPEEEDLTTAKLESVAQAVGLNMTAFNTCLQCEKYKEKVDGDKEEGEALGITSTPSFIIDGGMAVGNPPFAKFQEVIEQMLKESAN